MTGQRRQQENESGGRRDTAQIVDSLGTGRRDAHSFPSRHTEVEVEPVKQKGRLLKTEEFFFIIKKKK